MGETPMVFEPFRPRGRKGEFIQAPKRFKVFGVKKSSRPRTGIFTLKRALNINGVSRELAKLENREYFSINSMVLLD